ncbi:uncharacterized protein LOC135812533 [Sycon ciliatum]|uniref:uncharacterized protein LOC135812533 n=1 Tax=Sycon ciliatum TaxID=27933 RepID=UPI0031F65F49
MSRQWIRGLTTTGVILLIISITSCQSRKCMSFDGQRGSPDSSYDGVDFDSDPTLPRAFRNVGFVNEDVSTFRFYSTCNMRLRKLSLRMGPNTECLVSAIIRRSRLRVARTTMSTIHRCLSSTFCDKVIDFWNLGTPQVDMRVPPVLEVTGRTIGLRGAYNCTVLTSGSGKTLWTLNLRFWEDTPPPIFTTASAPPSKPSYIMTSIPDTETRTPSAKRYYSSSHSPMTTNSPWLPTSFRVTSPLQYKSTAKPLVSVSLTAYTASQLKRTDVDLASLTPTTRKYMRSSLPVSESRVWGTIVPRSSFTVHKETGDSKSTPSALDAAVIAGVATSLLIVIALVIIVFRYRVLIAEFTGRRNKTDGPENDERLPTQSDIEVTRASSNVPMYQSVAYVTSTSASSGLTTNEAYGAANLQGSENLYTYIQ